jgi:hypothetical protein
MLGRIVTANEILDAIKEMMPDDTIVAIVGSGGGGWFVRLNNHPENVLLRSADTFYQKLNDYCVRVEDWNRRYPRIPDAYGHLYNS